MKQYVQDRIIVAAGLVMVLLGFQVCSRFPEDSALFPEVCLLAVGALLVLLAITNEVSRRKVVVTGKVPANAIEMKWGPFLLVTVALGVYGFAVKLLGFYLASAVFVLIVGFSWGGVKKTTIVLFTICFLIFLYTCFTLLFNVPLPSGIAR